MGISLISAIDRNRGIGLNNQLLCSIKEDMQWFIDNTKGKTVVMGRLTLESIGKPLKNRKNIVLTRDKCYNNYKGVTVLNNIENVLKEVADDEEVMIIGGANVYTQFIPYADKLYLTEINNEFVADAFFPDFNKEDWVEEYSRKGTEETGFDYYFKIYHRRN